MFADDGVVTVGELLDKLVHQCPPGRLEDFVPSRLGPAEADVLEHRVVKQQRFLRDDADLLAEFDRIDFSDVDPVDADRTLDRVEQPGQQVYESRLARSIPADQCQHLARLDQQVDFRDRFGSLLGLSVVAERDVAELDRAVAAFDLLRQLGGGDPGATVHQFEDAVGGGAGPFQSRVDAREFPDGIDGAGQEGVQQRESRHVHHLGRQPDVPDPPSPSEHQVGSWQQRHAECGQSEQFGGRVGQRVDFHDLHRLVVVLAVLASELVFLPVGAVEGDDDLQCVERFGERLVDPRHALHHPVAGRLECLAVAVEDQAEDRHEQQ